MPRNLIFISYAHADKFDRLIRDELMGHLKTVNLDDKVWMDERNLRVGDPLHKEVQDALNSARIVIPIISLDFLNSDYISDHEMPNAMRAAEDNHAKLVPLMARPCLADHKTYDLGGGRQEGKLTKWLAGNSIGRPLQGMSRGARSTQLAEIAEKILCEYQRLEAPPAGTDFPVLDLGVRFHRCGDSLRLTYTGPEGVVGEDQISWSEHSTRAPFDLLFPQQTLRLDTLFDALGIAGNQPISVQFQVQIETLDAELITKRWSEARHNDQLLVELGWTFTTGPRRQEGPPPTPVPLDQRTRVLLIDLTTTHDLSDSLATVFEKAGMCSVQTATGASDAQRLLRDGCDLAFVFATTHGKGLEMQLGTSTAGFLAWTELHRTLDASPPHFLSLTLLGTGLDHAAALLPQLPPALSLTHLTCIENPDSDLDPARIPREFLYALLVEASTLTPSATIRNLDPEKRTTVLWGHTPDFNITLPRSRRAILDPFLALDRIHQRREIHGAAVEFQTKPDSRVVSVVVLGDEHNCVDQVGVQVDYYLREHLDQATVRTVRIDTPLCVKTSDDMLALMQTKLNRDEDLRSLLDGLVPKHLPGTFVLVLDWGVRDCTRETDSLHGDVEVWARFTANDISRELDGRLRIINLLSIESNPDEHSDLTGKVTALNREMTSSAFRLTTLPPLSEVTWDDLHEFLIAEGSHCPKDRTKDAADRILETTDGEFKATANELIRARRMTWDIYLRTPAN